MSNTLIRNPTYVWQTSYGLLEINGPDAKDLIHRLSTNDIMGLKQWQSTTTIFTNPKGRIIDRVRIAITESAIYMYTSASLAPTIAKWLDTYTFMEDISVEDVTEKHVIFEVMGIESEASASDLQILGDITGTDAPSLNGLATNQVKSTDFQVITRTDDPVTPTFLIHMPVPSTQSTLRMKHPHLFPNVEWLTASRRDALRIDAGIPQSPNELNLKTNPLEAGLRGDINFEKGCYIGQEVILRLDTYKKVKRHLIKVSLEQGTPPVIGSDIVRLGDLVSCGKLTSLSEKIDGTGFEGLALVKSAVQDFDQDFEIHQNQNTWKVYLHSLQEDE